MTIRYFCRNTNTDTTCDTAEQNQDLSQTQGSGPNTVISTNEGGTSFAEHLVFDTDISADGLAAAGIYSASLNITDTNGGDTEVRYRVQIINAACAVLQNSAYSATTTSTGILTLTTGTLTLGAGNRLRISIEIRRAAGHGNKNVTVATEDNDSWIDAPTSRRIFIIS